MTLGSIYVGLGELVEKFEYTRWIVPPDDLCFEIKHRYQRLYLALQNYKMLRDTHPDTNDAVNKATEFLAQKAKGRAFECLCDYYIALAVQALYEDDEPGRNMYLRFARENHIKGETLALGQIVSHSF